MSQRLVIEVTDGDNTIAVSYYKWGGYTHNSLNILDRITDFIFDNTPEVSTEYAVKMLEYAKSQVTRIFKYKGSILRKAREDYTVDDVIISTDGDEMDDILREAESLIIINLKDKTVHFDVYHCISKSKEKEYIEAYKEKIIDSDKMFNAKFEELHVFIFRTFNFCSSNTYFNSDDDKDLCYIEIKS